MNTLIDAAMTYSRSVLTAFFVVIVTGTAAYVNIPKENNPDIVIPNIMVQVIHEGISPEDAERLLIKPLEVYLRGVDGLKEMRATAQEGAANMTLEFEAGFDANQALIDVRDKIDLAKAKLPSESEEPVVREININEQPVVVVNLLSDMPERSLVGLARTLRDDIESLPGILEANLRGDREELIEVIINPALLESYNISQTQLVNSVLRNNRVVAAGTLDTGRGRFSIKVPGLFETARDVLSLPVKVDGDAVVTLADVTEVRRTFKDRFSYARIGDRKVISIEVVKRSGFNLIEAVEATKKVVAEDQRQWPENVAVTYAFDQSEDLKEGLASLQNSVISAILLVTIVIVAALGMRAAGLVGVAIPTSFLFGFLIMDMMGLSINQVILFGLILAVGLLVDGAIVVTEYADRKMAEGLDKRDAYSQAAKRMAWPITASTATTLAAFLPLIFWPGIVGEFMWYLPLTLILILGGSLISALVFLPVWGAIIGKPQDEDPEMMKALAASSDGEVDKLPGFTGIYARFLKKVITRPFLISGLAAGVLAVTWITYGFVSKGLEFFPQSEPRFVQVLVHARGNLSIDEKDVLVREVKAIAAEAPGIDRIYTTTLAASSSSQNGEDTIGSLRLELLDWKIRPPAREILNTIQARAGELPGIVIETRMPSNGPQQGKDIQMRFISDNPALLDNAVSRARAYMKNNISGLEAVEDDRSVPGIEWELKVDRAQASRYGADIVTVGSTVQLITNGLKVGDIRPDDADDEVDIRLRFPDDERSIERLDNLRVQTPGGMVPISNFVTRQAKPRVSKIHRVDGRRVMTIKANVAEGVIVDTKVAELKAWLADAGLDRRIRVEFAGQDRDQRESQAFLESAFLAALFLMAIILITQFNSFYYSFLIMSAVVMSTVGVLIGIMVTGRTFVVVMTGIGVISLAGIVVNNNIVLIDTYQRLRKLGIPVYDAILRTGVQRLRPVMLTTITTVIGLMPMVFSTNIDLINRAVVIGDPRSVWWVDLSLAIVFGLSFATVLTLIVTPCMLAAPEAWRERRARRKAAREKAAGPALHGAHGIAAE